MERSGGRGLVALAGLLAAHRALAPARGLRVVDQVAEVVGQTRGTDAGGLEHLAGAEFAGARLPMPARLLIGEHDPLGAVLAAGFERRGEDAAYEIVPGAGHFLPEERPALVADRALALLGRS